MNKPIGQDSSFNISLPMLIQAVGFISAMVWGYGQLNTRISFLEHQAQGNETAIEEMKAMQELLDEMVAEGLLKIVGKNENGDDLYQCADE